MMTIRSGSNSAGATRVRRALVGLVALIGVAGLAAAALAAPLPRTKEGAIGIAPARAVVETPRSFAGAPPEAILGGATILYDNLGNPLTQYYAGQGGHEAIDDLHLAAGGSVDSVVFEYYDPAAGGTISATVTLYGNPSGLDLATSPLLGTYSVSGLSRGRQIVSVLLPDGPVVGTSAWVGVAFSSTTAGLIVKNVPAIGSSHDLYLEDGDFYSFGGAPLANFALRLVDTPSYTLTLTTVGSGTVRKDPDQSTYLEGTLVQLTPLPDAHHHFVGWSVDASGSDDPLSLVMDGNKSVTATFAIDTYTLTYTAGAGGTITGDASQTVDYGADGTEVTATPNLGFHFVSWSDARPTATRTDLAVTANLSASATFAINTYTLGVPASAGGSVSKSPNQTSYDHGTTVGLTPQPSPGYHFVSWGGDTSGTANPLTVVITRNRSISATFAINTYTVSVSAIGSGSVGRTPDRATYDHGVTVSLTPSAAIGHHFVSWGGDTSGTTNPLSIVVTRNRSVSATFAINTYTLTYRAGSNGMISGATSQPVEHGSNGTQVTAVPDLGFHFVRWSDGRLTAARTDLGVTADLDVTATFARDNLACNGDFEVDLTLWAKYGSVDLTRVAPGRESSWAMQIKSRSSSDCGIDDLPNCITGTTLGNTYRFTAWIKAGSSSSLNRKAYLRIYEYDGSSQVGSYVTAELKLSAVWQKVSLDYVVRRSGTALSERIYYDPNSSGEFFFLDDVGIELLPPPVRFTITAGAGPGGAIAPSGAVIVNQGDSKPFSVTPSPGFRIQDVVLDGTTSLGAVPSYTFTNVQANRAIQATFAVIPPGANLIVDPSFESGIQYWTNYGSAALAWNSGDAHTGARSLQIASGDGSFGCDDNPNGVNQVAGVGAKYRFQAWVKALNATSKGKVKIRVYELAGSSQVGSTVYSQEIPLTLDWQLLTAEHTVRQANTALSMRVTDARYSSSVAETFLVDDVSISLVNPPAPGAPQITTPGPEAQIQFARPTVYPNPAHRVAMLGLSLAQPGALRAELYDVAGRVVRVLANEAEAAAGTHRFALENERHEALGAGIYFYRAEVAGQVYRGRFVILD